MALFKPQEVLHVFYLKGTTSAGLGDASGSSYANAKGIADGDLWAIPAGMLIQNMFAIIDVAVTGSTAIDIGDDDDADGFIPTAALTLGTPGAYGLNAKVLGAYLRVQTAGATDAGDIYVVPNAKWYGAAGKEVKVDNTTTNTAGALRVVLQGLYLGV